MTPEIPTLKIVDYTTLPNGPWQTVSSTHNALGARPRPILYLWAFDRPDSLSGQLISHGWAFLGPVHLLVSPSTRVEGPVLKSTQQIDVAISQFQSRPGTYRCPKLIDYEYRARYRGYPVNYLWCTDKSWQHGFTSLARSCHYFVVDLSTDERTAGLGTELTYLLDKVESERVLFLADTYRADLDIIQEFLRETWRAMAADSVNRRGKMQFPPLITYKSTQISYLAQATLSLWTGTSKIPLARRAAPFMGWAK